MNFKVGQKVMFELCNVIEKHNMPRYWWNHDKGPTNRWAVGEIEQIEPHQIMVAYTIKGYMGTGHVYFPNTKHESYTQEQWQYEGYLQSAECDCGSKSLGYTTHSHWCTAELYNRRKDGM